MGSLPVKVERVKRATGSYIHDQVEKTEDVALSHAIAAALFAAAGVFAFAALLVVTTLMFRWIEFRYGLFSAFAAIGGLLLTMAIICVFLASRRLKRPAKDIVSLARRLRTALISRPQV